jgi:hypothetical protein
MHSVPISTRLRLAFLALLAEGGHLAWEAWHGGIASHHLLQNGDLPAISNAWGLLVLPVLAAWAAGRCAQLQHGLRSAWPVAVGLLLPLLLGAALSLAFSLQMPALTEAVFFTLLLTAVVLPAHRPESLLGFVLGMSWTFGAVLPTLVGGIVALLSWLLRGAARRAWRAIRTAARPA